MLIQTIYSNRKTVAIQINSDLSVTVRAPRWVSKHEIEKIIKEKQDWITKHIERCRNQNAKYGTNLQPLTALEINELANSATTYIPSRVEYYASILGVTYGRITIRKQKTRWGSCSGLGNLNFNCLLMLTPAFVIDYVVLHELCHRKEMNHSKAFWSEVEKLMPDYKEAKNWLRTQGNVIMSK